MNRVLLAYVIIGFALVFVHYFLWARLIHDTALPSPWPSVLLAIYFTLLTSFFATRLFLRDAVHWFGWPGYTLTGYVAILFVCLCVADVVRLAAIGSSLLAGGTPLDPQRRVVLARVLSGAVVVLACVLGVRGMRTAIGGPKVREVQVPLHRLPRELEGYAIVQISDIHLGRTIGRDFAEKVVRRANALDPDIIVITGDLVDGTVEQLRHIVAPFGELRARHGIWFVTGNHEYYFDVNEWLAELGSMGIGVLRNERVRIGDGAVGFDLAGVDDWEADCPGHGQDLTRALAGRDPSRVVVLLAHQPRSIFEAARLGVDLQLSGHTHAGQIWPWNWLVRLQQPYVAGLHRHGDTHIYVSCGAGYWGPPMRVGTTPEITRLVLRVCVNGMGSDR